ncbi:MAG: hypothetical protein M3014_07505 [Chloroflexota bacterium]|nr:hypothetical protein [Chloroflexota bacterium]
MVIRLSGLHTQKGPQPGPDPAWARFSRDVAAKKNAVRITSLKPDVTAYRVLGAEPPSPRQAGGMLPVLRNRHNSSVYMAPLGRFQTRSASTRRVPVVGEIAAGQYDVTVAFQEYDCLDYEGGVLVDAALSREGAYALRVRGTSMTHVGIEPGDLVVVRPQSWADDGDFVVAHYTGEESGAGGSEGLATLKRFYKRRDHIFLQSATASTDPIRLFPTRRGSGASDRDPVRVQGVVTMVLKA